MLFQNCNYYVISKCTYLFKDLFIMYFSHGVVRNICKLFPVTKFLKKDNKTVYLYVIRGREDYFIISINNLQKKETSLFRHKVHPCHTSSGILNSLAILS